MIRMLGIVYMLMGAIATIGLVLDFSKWGILTSVVLLATGTILLFTETRKEK